MSAAAITAELHHELAAQGTTQFAIKNSASYKIDDEVRHNINIWAGSSSVSDGKKKIAEAQRAGITAKYVSEGTPNVAVEEEPIKRADVLRIVSRALKKTPDNSK